MAKRLKPRQCSRFESQALVTDEYGSPNSPTSDRKYNLLEFPDQIRRPRKKAGRQQSRTLALVSRRHAINTFQHMAFHRISFRAKNSNGVGNAVSDTLFACASTLRSSTSS